MQISFFDSVTSTSPKIIAIKDALLSFTGDRYKERITTLRELYFKDNNLYKKQKRSLPVLTFCGTFENGHKAENLVEYNKIMVIDVDHLFDEEFARVFKCLCEDPYTFAVWTSPSGVGIKALIQLEYDKEYPLEEWGIIHKIAFQSISSYYDTTYNIIIDKSGSDICRLCFVSYDNKLFNKEAKPFIIKNMNPLKGNLMLNKSNVKKYPQKSKHTDCSDFTHITPGILRYPQHKGEKNKPIDRDEITKIIRYLRKNSKSITTTYEDWYRVGYAIANTFTYDIGLKYYMRLCELDGAMHSVVESERMLVYCYKNLKNRIKFATILYLAEMQGYIRGSSQGNNSCRCESV